MLLDKNVRELPQNKGETLRRFLAGGTSEHARPEFSARGFVHFRAHTRMMARSGVILNRPLEKQVSEVVSEAPLNALDKVAGVFRRTSRARSFDICFAGVEERRRTQIKSQMWIWMRLTSRLGRVRVRFAHSLATPAGARVSWKRR